MENDNQVSPPNSNSNVDKKMEQSNMNQSQNPMSTMASSNVQSKKPQASNSKQIGHYLVGTQSLFKNKGRSLGQGTFGKVRLGTHMLTGESVAIKILEKDKIKDQSDVERVTREIHILKVVRHPHVVQLYEIIETSRQLFLIMEYASGGELFDYIVKRKRLQEMDACKFFQQLLSGVEYIHKVRICHRDLKPENLLLDDRNNVKIVDFGLSNTYKEGQTLKTACGSPCYASPEMIAGKRYIGLNSDIWSCGIILYAMTCGYLPFEDPNTNKLYKKILNCDFLMPGFISQNCKDLIRKILNTDPKLRITPKDIKNHPWYQQTKVTELEGIVIGKDRIPVIEEILSKLDDHFEEDNLQQAVTFVQNNKHNQVTSTYYLLMKRMERETGRNYVFEQVTRDKQRNLYSTSNLTNIKAISPQSKLQGSPQKVIMNQTVSNGFYKISDLRTQRTSNSNEGNSTQSKYQEQIDKHVQRRNDITATQKHRDMSLQEKINPTGQFLENNIGQSIHTSNYWTAATQPGTRQGQSQSPQRNGTEKSENLQNYSSAQPVSNTNYSFYMAERMKKKNPSSRPTSIDKTPQVIASTNDSKIQEILPSVQGVGSKPTTSQMRQTQYYAKLNQVQLNPFTQVNQTAFVNYNNTYLTNQTGVGNSTAISGISRAIVQSKVRKYRMATKGNESVTDANNFENIQPYPPNAAQIIQDRRGSTDNAVNQGQKNNMTIFTGYKPKYPRITQNNTTRPKEANQSLIQQIQSSENDFNPSGGKGVNNSFTAVPNTTASRMTANGNKHTRFFSNINMNNKQGMAVIQNNFVVPLQIHNNPNTNKTFYNMRFNQGTQNKNRSPQVNRGGEAEPANRINGKI